MRRAHRSAPRTRHRVQVRHRRGSHRPHPLAGRSQYLLGSHAAGGEACADAELRPTQWNLDRVRAATLCLVNRERTSRGERALVASSPLQQAAQGHTESMALGDYFDHVGPLGDTPMGRMRTAGYRPVSRTGYEVGENIGFGTLWLGAPRAIVAAWMASPGHRANILNPHFRDTAIGVSPRVPRSLSGGQAGGIYTEDFGGPIGG